MTVITSYEVIDWRYPTSLQSDGSDAVHKDPDYSCVYVILKCDDGKEGYGLTFTLGRGNEVIKSMCESLRPLVENVNVEEDFWKDTVAFQRKLTQDGQLRWVGPEKGVLAMACGAVLNAFWDLKARAEGKPLWEMVADMEPEVLVEHIDFKHMSDVITKDDALELLKKRRPGWEARKEQMKTDGFPAYTTSAGWLGYPEDKIRALCKKYVAEGHHYFKMKVGSADVADDVMRAKAIREEIGEENVLMMDANQKWDVPEAIENMKKLAVARPLWIEEPTNCDDVVGHREIQKALREYNVGVATGEVAHNKVMFKQLLQEQAIEFCQIDSCRIAGISEVMSVLLMAAKFDVKVCPHAGGVGLCEYVRHLSMIDYVCFASSMEGRVCESTTHLHEFFEDPVDFNKNESAEPLNQKYCYKAAVLPGYAKFHPEAITEWQWPFGTSWQDEEKMKSMGEGEGAAAKAAELRKRAQAAIDDEVAKARAVLARAEGKSPRGTCSLW